MMFDSMFYASLSRHLADMDRADAQHEALAIIENDLLEGECNPLAPDNFSEALGQMADEDFSAVCALLKNSRFADAARYLKIFSVDYWSKKAEKLAEQRMRMAS